MAYSTRLPLKLAQRLRRAAKLAKVPQETIIAEALAAWLAAADPAKAGRL